MTNYVYSAEHNSFFPIALKQAYIQAKSWPKDGVDVDEDIVAEFTSEPPTEKVRVAGEDGLPKWAGAPSKTGDEIIAAANHKRLNIIKLANIYISERQWPSKLILERLNDIEKVNFELWLDFLDALETLDVSNAPDIIWPKPPEFVANSGLATLMV
ncbi:tail fiber assembly protein [Siccibacter colletis]|uniref:tail fiber assembly protein n=1 Tax=Siccibacter colletis TaxID=1505757 RepID=UPI0028BF48BD|nr:tail fiber assembly protein [Siccibacter colletis]WNN49059.1 tail fiber assembly protein [Siccibacter colletis]